MNKTQYAIVALTICLAAMFGCQSDKIAQRQPTTDSAD